MTLGEITDKMARQTAAREILGLLCIYAERQAPGVRLAFYLFEDLGWTLVAGSEPPASAIDLARISAELLASGAITVQFEGLRWARHLCSGAGELLGLFTISGDSPPDGLNVVFNLATLAIEQDHQMGEIAFHAGQAAPTHAAPENEDLTQEVMRMISRQSTPVEILDTLRSHLGDIAFFLFHGGEWRLAGQSDSRLAAIDPEGICQRIFEGGADSAIADECWARMLCSGTGELFGLLVGFGDTPHGAHAKRIESACRLAVLAIEQTNLIDDLAFKADHDPLTGLPNRSYLERALRAAVAGNSRVALLYIDLDRFRLVNEVIGAEVGNRLLEEVAGRLRKSFPAGLTLARMGADEFALLVPKVAGPADASAMAARILRALGAAFLIDGHELFVNASIGISCPAAGGTPEALEREAYLALYSAKREGKARAMHFDPSMAAVPPERLEMEKRLRSAITRGEFVAYYQPQIDFATGQVSGVEALLRWKPEGLGLVSPAVFVPILEETGLIPEVGRWILRESCRQGKEWLDRDGLRLRIAVNVSAIQLLHPEFENDVKCALEETGFPSELLELELTESLFIGEFAPASRALRKLQDLGITTVLDDFGVGQSSLSYVHRLPFHRLKIDQSFIRGIADDDECPRIVRNIVQMARTLDLSIVAEGVETLHQSELLRAQGCEFGQGFYFSQPRPPVEAAAFCREFQALAPVA